MASYKWDRFTTCYGVIELFLSLCLIVLGVMFEYRQPGTQYSRTTQVTFAHLVLGYGLLLFLFVTILSFCVLHTYRCFSILFFTDLVLGALSIAFGVAVLIKDHSVLQHGYITEYLGKITFIKYIIGGVAIVHGIWLFSHALSTCCKRSKIKPNFFGAKKNLIKKRDDHEIDLDNSTNQHEKQQVDGQQQHLRAI